MKFALHRVCTREKISETLIQQLQSLLYYNNKDWDNLKIGWTSWCGKRHISRNSCKSNKHILIYHCRRKFIQLITDGYLKKSFSWTITLLEHWGIKTIACCCQQSYLGDCDKKKIRHLLLFLKMDWNIE